MALLRDFKRLSFLASSFVPSLNSASADEINKALDELEQATNFVVNFNMKGLQRIETTTFFPWLKKTFCNSFPGSLYATDVLAKTLKCEENHIKLKKKSGDLLEIVRGTKSASNQPQRLQMLGKVASLSMEMSYLVGDNIMLEESSIIPAIIECVSEKDQKSVNTKVMLRLGVLESRIHLLSMYETVISCKDKSEYEVFRKVIPSIPQRMIPRWRKTIYLPKVGALQDFS